MLFRSAPPRHYPRMWQLSRSRLRQGPQHDRRHVSWEAEACPRIIPKSSLTRPSPKTIHIIMARYSRRSAFSLSILALGIISILGLAGVANAVDDSDARPQYTYGHEIPVTCLERNMFVFNLLSCVFFLYLCLASHFSRLPFSLSKLQVLTLRSEKPASTSKTTRAASNTFHSQYATKRANHSSFITESKQTSTVPLQRYRIHSITCSSSIYTMMHH